MTLVFLASCASQGTRVHDMSVAGHEQAGQRESQLADAEAANYISSKDAVSTNCDNELVCWTTWSNPSSEHLVAAERHRRLARKHREAAENLRAAESEACANIPERDRDLSPFFHRDDLVRVDVPESGSKDPVLSQ
ncbi:MAG: hypothetical protein ACPG4T_05660 [Nannocystaceae bacterium]